MAMAPAAVAAAAAPAPKRAPFLFAYRSSVAFIIITVAFAVFTDVFLYGVIVPVVPFALESRVDIAGGQGESRVPGATMNLPKSGAVLAATEIDQLTASHSAVLGLDSACSLWSRPPRLLAEISIFHGIDTASHSVLTNCFLAAIWGYLADRISSRRMPMVAGLLLLGGATALLCAGTSIPLLVVGRLLQGASAALVWTVGLALIVDATSSENMGKAMGWVGMAMSAGILSSPMLGGLVYSAGGYYAVFAMCFGLIAVDTAMRLMAIDVKTARVWLEEAPKPADGGIALDDERRHADDGQNRTAEPTPRGGKSTSRSKPAFLTLLRSPRLLAALWGTLVHGIVTTSFDSTLPLFVSETFDWDSAGAGLIFLPLVTPSLLGPLVGAACDRWGARPLSSVGFLVATPFLICLRFVGSDGLSQKAILCVLLVGVGVAMALVLGPLMAEITWVVEDVMPTSAQSSYAQAYGLYNMAFSGGALLGPIIGGMIRDAAGWGTVGWTLGLVTFVTSVTQVVWIGGPLIRHRTSDEAGTES